MAGRLANVSWSALNWRADLTVEHGQLRTRGIVHLGGVLQPGQLLANRDLLRGGPSPMASDLAKRWNYIRQALLTGLDAVNDCAYLNTDRAANTRP